MFHVEHPEADSLRGIDHQRQVLSPQVATHLGMVVPHETFMIAESWPGEAALFPVERLHPEIQSAIRGHLLLGE